MEIKPIKIQQQIEDKDVFPIPRPYLGYSILGHKCKRFVLYLFRHAFTQKYDPRQQRLFDRGEYEENVLIKELENCGCKVFDTQLEVSGIQCHSGGHIDGKILGIPGDLNEVYLFECKTANEQRFNDFVKLYDPETNHKKLIEYEPAYVWQIQLYMGKLKLKKCLFVVTNKNTEERIYFIINFDKSIYDIAKRAELDVLLAERQFDRIGNNEKTWFECKMCDARKQCFGIEPINENCRTCKFSEMEDEGKWSCSFHKIDSIKFEDQLKGCKNFIMSKMFNPYGN